MKKKELTFSMVTTKGGDHGESSLYNGERRRKDDLIFEVLGDLDELGSFLGLARASLCEKGFTKQDALIQKIQKTLFIIGGEVAMPPDAKQRSAIKKITEDDIVFLEEEEKRIFDKTVIEPLLTASGRNTSSALVDVCRTISRRCERKIVAIISAWGWDHLSLSQKYLNRLSDLLFLMVRNLE